MINLTIKHPRNLVYWNLIHAINIFRFFLRWHYMFICTILIYLVMFLSAGALKCWVPGPRTRVGDHTQRPGLVTSRPPARVQGVRAQLARWARVMCVRERGGGRPRVERLRAREIQSRDVGEGWAVRPRVPESLLCKRKYLTQVTKIGERERSQFIILTPMQSKCCKCW